MVNETRTALENDESFGGAAVVQPDGGLRTVPGTPSSFTVDPSVPLTKTIDMTYYKHELPSCNYVFKNGKTANFVNYIYATNKIEEIAELDAEIKGGHLRLAKSEGQIDVEELTDPMVAIKNRAIREYLAAQGLAIQKAKRQDNDAGFSIMPAGIGAANTNHSIDPATAMIAAAQASSPEGPGAALFPAGTQNPALQAFLAKTAAKK